MARGDRISELLDLPQQRRLQRTYRGHHLVDAPQFRVGARRDNHSGGPPCSHQGSGECHPFPISDRCLLGHGVRGLVDRNRLAGKRRLLRPQVLHVHQAKVRRDLVPGFEKHDVARNQHLRRDHSNLLAAQRSGFRREHVADRIQRLLRFALLNEAEQRIDEHDTQNDGGIQPETDHQLDEAGSKQNIDQDVVQLHEKPHERPSLASFR